MNICVLCGFIVFSKVTLLTFLIVRALSAATSIQSTRYYFGNIRLRVNPVTLSMVSSSKLTPDLKAIKHAMPVHLISFEQAHIDMRKFCSS